MGEGGIKMKNLDEALEELRNMEGNDEGYGSNDFEEALRNWIPHNDNCEIDEFIKAEVLKVFFNKILK
jgi:hypothetical protein